MCSPPFTKLIPSSQYWAMELCLDQAMFRPYKALLGTCSALPDQAISVETDVQPTPMCG